MSNLSKEIHNDSVSLLTKLWSDRYLLDLSTLKSEPTNFFELIECASPEGRAKTVAFVKRLLKLDCEWGVAKTNALFNAQSVSLLNTNQMAETIQFVYEKALDIYQQEPSPVSALTVVMPDKLSITFEQLLTTLRQQHTLASDPRSIGFISTQIYYTSRLLLDQLSRSEQILLNPYFKFLEEQVCIPFQRVCIAAANLEPDSPSLTIVQQLLPACHDIAKTVYRRAVKLYTRHQSRRGTLSHPGVKASAIRDLEMMQGYLWLCILENNFTAVEQELIPLCVLVFPSVQVTWELVQQMLEMLMDEVLASVEPDLKPILRSSALRMQYLFSEIEKKAS